LQKIITTKFVTDVSDWTVPSNINFGPQKISEIDFNEPKKMNSKKLKSNKTKADYVKNPPAFLDNTQTFNSFFTKLKKVNENSAILKVIPPFNLKFKSKLFPKIFLGMYKDEDLVTLGYKLDFSLTKDDCENIEKLTIQ